VIRLDLTPRPLARAELTSAPVALLSLDGPAARLDLTLRPVCRLTLPEFPADLTEDFITMNGDFVFMNGEKIWM